MKGLRSLGGDTLKCRRESLTKKKQKKQQSKPAQLWVSVRRDTLLMTFFCSNHNYRFKLWLFKNCGPLKPPVFPSTVITEYVAAAEGGKKERKQNLYFGPHHVFKSKSSILDRLLLSIGPKIIHSAFIPCHADSTSSLCHEQPGFLLLPLSSSFFFITHLIAHSTLTRAH